MRSSASISLTSVQLFLCSLCFAQPGKIDSLKKALPALHDTVRIDCLNGLSQAYINNEQKDSALYFASLANQEANKCSYINGIAVSWSNKGQIAKHFDDDYVQSEKYGKESLRLFETTGNKQGLEELYGFLLHTFIAQSKFDEALSHNKKYYEWLIQKGNQEKIVAAISWMFWIYCETGNYEKSFFFAQQEYDLAIKAGNKFWISKSLFHLGYLYQLIEDYPAALNYYRKLMLMDDSDIVKVRIRSDSDIWFKMQFTEVLFKLNQFDSAWRYYNLYNPGEESIYNRVYLVSTGECYLQQKKYSEALHNLMRGLALHKEKNDRNEMKRAQLDIARVYLAQGNNLAALEYAKDGLTMALQTKTRAVLRDAYEILHSAYDNLHKYDSAYLYYQKYISMKDSVSNDQIKGKFAAYNYEKKIESINKEKEIQRERLQKETFTKRVLIAGISVLLSLAVIIFWNFILKRRNEKQRLEHELQIQKLESERSKAEFQQQATELEMQALRAQMNPHFIFNSLNSINRFILQNNSSLASEYLTKFSKLVRMILQNSQAPLISLESELESLKLYLELEALRFNYHFAYKITFPKEIDIEVLKVPPLIIQPYAENAIWHGLMPKEEKGQLDIEISQENDHLFFKISDDGIGRKAAEAAASKSATRHKSMGLQITADRITMLQKSTAMESPVVIIDLLYPDGSGAGTEVIIKIPVIYD